MTTAFSRPRQKQKFVTAKQRFASVSTLHLNCTMSSVKTREPARAYHCYIQDAASSLLHYFKCYTITSVTLFQVLHYFKCYTISSVTLLQVLRCSMSHCNDVTWHRYTRCNLLTRAPRSPGQSTQQLGPTCFGLYTRLSCSSPS